MDLGPTLNLGRFHLEILNYVYKDTVSKYCYILRFLVDMNFLGDGRDQTIVSWFVLALNFCSS